MMIAYPGVLTDARTELRNWHRDPFTTALGTQAARIRVCVSCPEFYKFSDTTLWCLAPRLRLYTCTRVLSLILYNINMSPRPDDVRLKQLQHEKAERIKRGLDKLERHSGKYMRMLELSDSVHLFTCNVGSTQGTKRRLPPRKAAMVARVFGEGDEVI